MSPSRIPAQRLDAAASQGAYEARLLKLFDELEEIQTELLAGCSDSRGRVLAVAQRNISARRELLEALDVAERDDRLETQLTDVERQMGGQGGGVLSTDEAPPFNPPGGTTH